MYSSYLKVPVVPSGHLLALSACISPGFVGAYRDSGGPHKAIYAGEEGNRGTLTIEFRMLLMEQELCQQEVDIFLNQWPISPQSTYWRPS